MNIKRIGMGVLGALAAVTLAACSSGGPAADTDSGDSGSSGDTVKIKFGHVISPGDTQSQAYDLFAATLDEKTDGRIKVEVYPDSQLGGEQEMIEAVQNGEIEMTAPSVGVLANFDPALQIFDFPFIFEEAEKAYEVLDSDFGKGLLSDIEGSGLKALGWGENGFRNLAMTSKTVTSPADMKGAKLRTMQVPMHVAYWESIGAAPTPMPFPEVFTALQQGVVDGVENPYELLYSAKLTEPAHYLTATGHIYDPEIILIGKDFFDGLSAEDQALIQESMDEAIAELRKLKVNISDEIRAEIEAAGGTVTELTPAQREEWIDSAVPFYAANADKVDTEKLKQLLEAAGNTKFLEAIE